MVAAAKFFYKSKAGHRNVQCLLYSCWLLLPTVCVVGLLAFPHDCPEVFDSDVC